MIIDAAHHEEFEKIDSLARIIETSPGEEGGEAEKFIFDVCEKRFKGNQSLDFYCGLFAGYVNSYILLDEIKESPEGKEGTELRIILAFLASKLKKMQIDANNNQPEPSMVDEALAEYETTWDITTKERNHLRRLFEKVAGQKLTKLEEGENCPGCDGKISKDLYCRNCGYGV